MASTELHRENCCTSPLKAKKKKAEHLRSLRCSPKFNQSLAAFAFIAVVFLARRLQPEPPCTWHKQRQSGMKSLLVSLSITTQCNERLRNTNESGSRRFQICSQASQTEIISAWTRGNIWTSSSWLKADVNNQVKRDLRVRRKRYWCTV